MHNTITDLSECTEFRQTLQARPPRIVHGTVLLLCGMLGGAFLWAALTEADLVVRAQGRIRPLQTPYKIFNPVRGEVLSASTGGRVAAVYFREGDEVKRGDVLLRFDTERLDNEITKQKKKIQAGEEEVVLLAHKDKVLAGQLETNRAKAEAETEQAEAEVKRALEQQAADVRLARAELENALDEENRLQRLLTKGAAAPAEIVAATTKRRVAQEKLARTSVPLDRARVEVMRQARELVEKDFAVRRQESVQQRAAKETELAGARIELANLELERQQADLTAPLDGIVTAGEVKVGDLLEPGKPILEIAQAGGFRFEALVANEEIAHLKVGMPVRIKLDPYDYQKYGTLEGTISFIAPDSTVPQAGKNGDATSKGSGAAGYLVKIDLDGAELVRGPHRGRLKLGMTGQVEIVTDQESLLSLLLKKVRQSISLG